MFQTYHSMTEYTFLEFAVTPMYMPVCSLFITTRSLICLCVATPIWLTWRSRTMCHSVLTDFNYFILLRQKLSALKNTQQFVSFVLSYEINKTLNIRRTGVLNKLNKGKDGRSWTPTSLTPWRQQALIGLFLDVSTQELICTTYVGES